MKKAINTGLFLLAICGILAGGSDNIEPAAFKPVINFLGALLLLLSVVVGKLYNH